MEMSQELPVRNGTQTVRSRELGPSPGWVAVPGDSPGANHPLQAHILDQLASSVSCMRLWCPLVDRHEWDFPSQVPKGHLGGLSALEIQCTAI